MDGNRKVVIAGVELDFDIFDADSAERFENAVEQVSKEGQNVERQSAEGEIKVSESIRRQCKAVFGFFNSIFGEGTDKKIFGERVNLMQCISAFEETLAQIDAQKAVLNDKLKSATTPNRAQRRAKK